MFLGNLLSPDMAKHVVKPKCVCVCVKCKLFFLSASISVLLLEQGRRIFSLPVLSSVLDLGGGEGSLPYAAYFGTCTWGGVCECVCVYILYTQG